MDKYRIQVRGDDDKPEAAEISGTIVGPFGVAECPTQDGWYRVTHLHSGLKINALCSLDRDNCIEACKEVWAAYPYWRSHKSQKIAEWAGLTTNQLKERIENIACFHGCEGEPYEEE